MTICFLKLDHCRFEDADSPPQTEAEDDSFTSDGMHL